MEDGGGGVWIIGQYLQQREVSSGICWVCAVHFIRS